MPAGARAYRYFQPVVLRRDARGARASGISRPREAAAGARDAADLETAPPGHQRVRALPDAERLPHSKVLSQRLARGAAPPLPGAAGAAREELQVLARGSGGT